MYTLRLTDPQRKMLRNVLDTELSELHRELADTDGWRFKEALRVKQQTLQQILDVLDLATAESEVEEASEVIL